jgi:TolB-like protein/DNA-binding winged helix-turn-helix (wHTH) protein
LDLNGDARLRFDDFEFDPLSGQLLRNGQPIRIQPQPLRVLRLLLERPGQTIPREELREHVWGGTTYVEFEQGLNYCIRQIRLALGDNAASPVYVETLPKQGYRFLQAVVHADGSGTARGVPIPANGSLELPNRHQPLEALVSISRIGSKHARWFVAAGLCFLLIIVPASMYLARQPHIASLAVLPLDNLSGDPGQDYFADGMTDELITMLAKNSTLRIVSRTSVMQYKRAHRPLPEIARGLGVDRILEGSVAHTNTGVHMTVQLIDARTDTHLWAESFDRDTSGSVSLAREVAQSVARKLSSALPEKASTRYVRPEAHDAYLRGRYLWFTNRNDKAGEYFLKATRLQPDYALAWTGVALYYGAGAVEGEMNPGDSLPRAKAAALKAASLDDSLPEVHVTLGNLAFFADWNWQRAQRECSRAIELDPTLVEAYFLQSKIFRTLNRPAESIGSARKAMELNPFARPEFLAWTLDDARQYDAAIIEARARLESIPADVDLLWMIQYAYGCKGMRNEAVQTAEKALQISGDNDSAAGVRQAFERGGYRAGLQRWLMDSKKRSQREYVSSYFLASLTAQLGQREQTLAFLEQGFKQDDPNMVFTQCDCEYDFLHSDERYRSLIKKIGLPPAY